MVLPRPVFLQTLLVLIAAATGLAATPASAPPNGGVPLLVVEGLGKGAVPLDGPWQFHLGDHPAWAAPDIDDSAAQGWEQLTTDQPWGLQGHYDYVGFAWYRRHVTLRPGPGELPDLALLMHDVDDVYEVYWNGVRVGSSGKLPPNPVLYFEQPDQTFGLGPARSGVLAVRVWMPAPMSSDPGTSGGFESVPLLGTSEATAAAKTASDYRWLRSRQFAFGLETLSVLFGLIALFLWFRDRGQWTLFWMAGVCFYTPLNLLILQMRFHWPAQIEFALMQPVYASLDISLWFLLLWLLDLRGNPVLVRWVRLAAIALAVNSLLDGLVALIGWTSTHTLAMQVADALLSTFNLILTPISVFLVGYAVLRQMRSGARLNSVRWALTIFVAFDQILTESANAASQGLRFTRWTFTDFFESSLFSINGSSFGLPTLANTAMLLTLVYAVYRDQVDHRRRQQLLEQEFQSARELQQVLIPEDLPCIPGYTLTSAYKPASEVGGDFFQIVALNDQSTLIVLGDVSGKGLKAAMAVSLIVGAIRTLAEITHSPAEILGALNRRLCGRLQGGFATAIALHVPSNGTLTVASAGHLSPFLGGRELNLPAALPLGIFPGESYEEAAFAMQESDRLAVFTDGLLEARNRSGELFGFDRVQTLFASRPTAEQATEAAVNFGQDDDITVLTLTRAADTEDSVTTAPVSSAAARFA